MNRGFALVLLAIAACGRVRFGALGDAQNDVPSDVSAPDAGPASCDGLPSTCGASANGSCCESPLVPGGTFFRTFDLGTDAGYTDMTHPATVSSFRLDRYETTVGRFRQFVAAGMGTQTSPPAAGAGAHAAIPNSGWDPSWNTFLAADTPSLIAALACNPTFATWTDAPAGNENRPIDCILWYEAMAFCIWDGGYLATEAEWNYAAVGGAEQRAYPWSSPASSIAIDDTDASYYVNVTRQCGGDMLDGCALEDVVPVGTRPNGDGPWGHSELSGNIWEWVLDWNAAYQDPCTDCAIVTGGTERIERGGSFDANPGYLRPARRVSDLPDVRAYFRGIRCARPP